MLQFSSTNEKSVLDYFEDINNNPLVTLKSNLSYNGVRVSFENLRSIGILSEKILTVRQECEALGPLPTGILSPITIAIRGAALRHEYSLVKTTNHIILVELIFRKSYKMIRQASSCVLGASSGLGLGYISGQNSGNSGFSSGCIAGSSSGSSSGAVSGSNDFSQYYLVIEIHRFDTKSDYQFLKREYYKNRSFPRNLQKVKGKKLYTGLKFHQVLRIIVYAQFEVGQQKYDLIAKNCKLFPQTLIHFCRSDATIDDIARALFGKYSDAIGIFFNPIVALKDYNSWEQQSSRFWAERDLIRSIRNLE